MMMERMQHAAHWDRDMTDANCNDLIQASPLQSHELYFALYYNSMQWYATDNNMQFCLVPLSFEQSMHDRK